MKLNRLASVSLLFTLFYAAPAFAADHYIRAGANGNGSGSDWTNACNGFSGSCSPGSMVRGDTYYVATGTYASVSFGQPTSGSLVITILGATAADHGTSAGWSNSFSVNSADGGQQARFQNSGGTNVAMRGSYYVFDGSVGSGNVSSSYGFLMMQPSSCGSSQNYVEIGASTITDVTVSHVAIISCGPGFDVSQNAFSMSTGANYLTNITIAHSYISGANNSWNTTNLANSFIEYNYSEKQWSTSAHHGETIGMNNCHNSDFSGCSSNCPQGFCAYNVSVRYNVIRDCNGTACIAAIGPGNVYSMRAWKVYGNVFTGCGGGDGVISNGGSNFVMKDVQIYNNTFVNCNSIISKQCDAGASACSQAAGNVFKNNLLVNSGVDLVRNGGAAYDRDYNSYYAPIDPVPTESHGQVLSSSSPLVNINAGNYRLTAPTSPGVALSAPFDIDGDGVRRGGDGVWDRGAFEFSGGGGGGSDLPPSAPQGLRILSSQ